MNRMRERLQMKDAARHLGTVVWSSAFRRLFPYWTSIADRLKAELQTGPSRVRRRVGRFMAPMRAEKMA